MSKLGAQLDASSSLASVVHLEKQGMLAASSGLNGSKTLIPVSLSPSILVRAFQFPRPPDFTRQHRNQAKSILYQTLLFLINKKRRKMEHMV